MHSAGEEYLCHTAGISFQLPGLYSRNKLSASRQCMEEAQKLLCHRSVFHCLSLIIEKTRGTGAADLDLSQESRSVVQ